MNENVIYSYGYIVGEKLFVKLDNLNQPSKPINAQNNAPMNFVESNFDHLPFEQALMARSKQMNEIVIYTYGYIISEKLFVKLDNLNKKYLPSMVYILGNDIDNELFITWAKANDISFIVQEVNEKKYGYSAFKKAAIALFQNKNITTLVVSGIDSVSIELTHLARTKNKKVYVL